MEIFVIKNDQEKPKYYSSHRTRQSSKRKSRFMPNQSKIENFIGDEKRNILEIGFGTGSSVVDHYRRKKERSYCIESYEIGVENINNFIKENNIKDIYVFLGDAIEIIENKFPDNSLDEILIFFPDPWPKNKHRKRRILNNFSLNMFFSKLKMNGLIHFATDHINYAYTVRGLISKYTNKKQLFSKNRRYRPITNYERRGIKRNNFVFDIILQK